MKLRRGVRAFFLTVALSLGSFGLAMLASAMSGVGEPGHDLGRPRLTGLASVVTETTTVTLTPTPTETVAGTPTETETPTVTPTPTETSTPTVTPTPTATTIPEICALVYADTNGNEERDLGEALVGGAWITITTASHVFVDHHLTTGKDEPWCQGNLALGTYIVREESPPGYLPAHQQLAVFFPPGRTEQIEFPVYPIPTATPTPTSTTTATASATATATHTATPGATATPSATLTGSPSDTATPTPSPSHSPTGTLPPTTTATPTATSTPSSCPDAYEPDDQWWQARPIGVNGPPQQHDIHTPGDVDWVKFGALGQVDYTIFTDKLSPLMDTYICLYDTDGQTRLPCSDDDPFSPPGASRIRWRSPAPGTYFVMIRHFDPTSGGCDRTYHVAVTGLIPPPSPTPGTTVIFLPWVAKNYWSH